MTTLVKNQKKTFRADYYVKGEPRTLIAKVRHDDECNNGHNSFSITGELYEKHCQRGEPKIQHKNGKLLWLNSCGCIHEEIAKHLPELAPYIKWHLCSTDEPLHYIANTLYHAGDKDCWGGRKGEVRFYRYNVEVNGALVFNVKEGCEHELPDKDEAEEMALRINGKIIPVPWMLHEGKERDLKAARSCAIWPEATDEELMAPDLKEKLEARHAQLMADFRAAVEKLGFTY